MEKRTIGICVSDSMAYLLEKRKAENLITVVEADEAEEKKAFFKRIVELTQHFDQVRIYGSAKSKHEIILRMRRHAVNIQIDDRMDDNQDSEALQFDFINDYFNT